MFMFFRYLIKFIRATAFKAGELNVNKPTFNPLKLFFVIMLTLYIVLSFMSLMRLVRVFVVIDSSCPGIIRILDVPGDEDYLTNTLFDKEENTLKIKCDLPKP